uniref:Pilus assembly protein n=1 Tax=Fundidesulfovibrio putealis TaxID=270496 RepID=A0A7C4AAX9_9BACT
MITTRQKEHINKYESGASVTEFALLMLPLMLLLLGGVEFGRYFWVRHVVTSAAHEGARMAILNEPTDAEVRARVNRALADGGVSAQAQVSVSSRQANQPVSVTVTMPFNFLGLPGFIPALDDVAAINATAVMVHEP